MRNSTALAVGWAGLGLTAFTSGGYVLGIISPPVGIALVAFGLFAIVAALIVWRRGEPNAQGDTSLARLRDVLARGIQLRTYVLMEGAGAYENTEGEVIGGDPYPITRDERLCKWAREALDVLESDFPEHADEFYGEDASYGSSTFMLAYSAEVNRDGRSDYLERRIALLRRMLDPETYAKPS
jgi:hypothetical protein